MRQQTNLRKPRFVVRHNNGKFHVFDLVNYRAVTSRDTQADAQACCDYRNSKGN